MNAPTSRLRPAMATDTAAIAALMSRVHGVGAEHPNLRPDHLCWKYFAPRTDHPGPRSWVVDLDGTLLAHCGVWPGTLLTTEGVHPTMHGFDWVAAPDTGGAGMLVLRRAMREAGSAIAAGGSRDAVRMFPALGFRQVQRLEYYVRPVRPFRQAWTRSHGWSSIRLPRNLLWSAWPPKRRGWTATRVAPADLDRALLPAPSTGLSVFGRSRALFEWYLDCPITRSGLWRADGAEAHGYFCLSRIPGITRIVDAWTPSPAVQDWTDLYAAAIAVALEDPDTCEVATLTGIARARTALANNGLRQRGHITLAWAGRGLPSGGNGEVHFQWIDHDKGVLHSGIHDYFT